MRSAVLLGLALATLVIAALVSPLVGSGLAELGWTFRPSRVQHRVFEILFVAGLALLWRRLDLGDAASLGLRGEGWRRSVALGLVLGLAGIGVALLLAWAGGGLVPALRYPVARTLGKLALALLAAVILGFGEEFLFRGIFLRRFRSDLGALPGLLLTTALFALTHALSGAGPAVSLAEPRVLPGLVGLFGLGLLLAVLRLSTGSLMVAVGIHVAIIGVLRAGRLFFSIPGNSAWLVGPGWPPFVGGLAGAAAGVTIALLAWAWLRRSTIRDCRV